MTKDRINNDEINKTLDIVVECNVKPEHIDVYKHLNNAFYPLYFDMARKELQKYYGFSDHALATQGVALIVAESCYKFIRQVKAVDLQIKAIMQYNQGSIITDYEMIKSGEVVAKAVTRHGFIDLATGKVLKPPAWFKNLFLK